MSESRASFHFDLDPRWEEAVRRGGKTIDVRVNIAPYADVKKGDVIRYGSTEVVVRSIRAYPGISDLLAYEGHERVVPGAADLKEALKVLLEIFHYKEPPHGVLAFEIEPLKD
ncbi:MAG TPA: hypothetical protein ENJ04_07375 [Nitrospirae bacterium]|nr:hypothetical protein [Nitrospirota bacterium]